MAYKILKLSEVNEIQMEQAIEIFVDGFFNIFSILSKDKQVLKRFFKEALVKEMNYVYLHEHQVIGFLGLGDASRRCTRSVDKVTFKMLFGKLKSFLLFKFIPNGLSTPRVTNLKEVEIEYLATAPAFRGKGIATKLIDFAASELGYKQVVLDVYSNNDTALRLYEKLGFKKVEMKSEFILILTGVGKTIKMKKEC